MTPTELCAHTFYGGREKSNLGAVCVLPPNAAIGGTRRILSIENYRKSPQYTRDFYHLSINALAGVSLLESFCKAVCFCSRETDDEKGARMAVWNKNYHWAREHEKGKVAEGCCKQA